MELNGLSGHPLFRRVEPRLLREALNPAEMVEVEQGETVYDRRRFRRCLGILLEGELQVRKETLLMSHLKEGDVFGAAALFHEEDGYPTTLTALARCRLLLIPQESVLQLIRTCGPFAEDYVRYLSGRIRFLSQRVDTLSAERGEGRLARYLLTAEDGAGLVAGSATQLCQRIGVGRATLYRAFEVLENCGAIVREGKSIRISNRETLRTYCERV